MLVQSLALMEERVHAKKIRISPNFHHLRHITGGWTVRDSFLEVRSFRKGITLVGFAQADQSSSSTKFFHGAAMAAMGARGASMGGAGVEVFEGTHRPYPFSMLPSRLAQPSSKPPISSYVLRRLTISFRPGRFGRKVPGTLCSLGRGGPTRRVLASERSPLAPLSPMPHGF